MPKIYVRLNSLILVILAVLLIFLATFRPVGLDADSLSYLDAYDSFLSGTVIIMEPTFNLFSLVSGFLFGYNGLFFVFFLYAFFAISIKFFAIQKYSKSILLSTLVYLCMFYILHELTQIRVGLAAALFLLAVPDLVSGNKKRYIVKVLIACTCHLSAIALLPLFLLSNKKINYALVFFSPIIFLFSVLVLGDVSHLLISFFSYFPSVISDKAISYINGVQLYDRFDKVNIFSKITISTYFIFVIYFIAVLRQKNASAEDIIYLKLFSIMLTVFYILSGVPVLASRTFELMAVSFIFSFPQLISRFKPIVIPGLIISLWLVIYLYVVNLKLIGF